MSGTLINTGGGGWMNLAPGVSIPGVTPAQPQQQYDMWGRPVGGAGLGNLYNAVTAAQSQQQMPTNAPNLAGIGSSGYDQWGRQAPVAAGSQQAPSLFDQTAWLGPAQSMWLESQGAPDADVLRAGLNVPGLSSEGRANIVQAIQQAGGQPSAWGGGGYGLLGAAAGRGGGEGGYGGGITGGSTGALGAGGPPGGSGNAAVDAAAAASEHAAAEEEQALGGMY